MDQTGQGNDAWLLPFLSRQLRSGCAEPLHTRAHCMESDTAKTPAPKPPRMDSRHTLGMTSAPTVTQLVWILAALAVFGVVLCVASYWRKP
jgi:hypothetical protein